VCFQYTVVKRAVFKGGQTGQLPRAFTTKGPPEKSENYYIKKYFLKLIIWNKKYRVGHRVYM